MATGTTTDDFTTEVTEVIDLENPERTCNDYFSYPIPGGTEGAVGGLLNNETPIICGGYFYPQLCFFLGILTVQAEAGRKYWASQAVVPSNDKSSLWAIGGFYTNTTEYINPYQEDTPNYGPQLPYKTYIFGHCFVQLDADTYMLLGGFSVTFHSDTFFLHAGNQSFTSGPQLTKPNRHMSCGVIETMDYVQDDQVEEIVVVAGGQYNVKEIETWPVASLDTEFTVLDNATLPKDLYRAATVVTSDRKSMIIVGGWSGLDDPQDSLIKISCTSRIICEVEKMRQKLRIPRMASVAMLIPTFLSNCH